MQGTPRPDEADAGHGDWTGRREHVSGPAVVVGAVVIAVLAIAVLATVTRSPDIVAQLSQDYVRMMAGQLGPAIEEPDAEALARELSRHLPGTPRVALLEPDFTLRGGRPHEVDGRRAAAWFYEAASAELAIAEAVDARLADLPDPDETRSGVGPPLYIYRKQMQTVGVWEERELVYVFISTLPSERVIALARRLADPVASREEPA